MKISNFLAYSNLLTSFCAASLCIFSLGILQFNKYFWECTGLVFFATWFTYLFHRLIDLKIHGNFKKTNRDLWHFENSLLGLFCLVISFSGTIFFLLTMPLPTALILMPLGILSIGYIWQYGKISILPLRKVPFLKAFLIAICWSLACCGIPITANLMSINEIQIEHLFLGFSILFFLFGQVIQFDFRDRIQDQNSGLKTFAHVFKHRNLNKTSFLSYLLSIISLAFIPELDIFPLTALSLGLIGSAFLIILAQRKENDLYYSFYLESSLAYPFLFFQLLIFLGE